MPGQQQLTTAAADATQNITTGNCGVRGAFDTSFHV